MCIRDRFGGVQTEKSNFQKVMLYFVLFIIGALMLGAIYFFKHTPTGLTIYFSIWMVMLTMTIVSDYSDVLVDTKDNFTLLPTPIKGVTISTARLVRIMIFLFKQAFAFALPALIYWAFNDLLGLFVYIFSSMLTIVMSLCLVTIVYLVAMKYSSPSPVSYTHLTLPTICSV